MAVSERIKAEARRTIDGMQKYYEKYSDDVDDPEELEHRIARVEASLEGCNGLSQEEKIQKTAENLFELTCSQERSYDALRIELKHMQNAYKEALTKIGKQFSNEIKELQTSIKDDIKRVADKIEESGSDGARPTPLLTDQSPRDVQFQQPCGISEKLSFLTKIISDHPQFAFATFIFLLILVFVSGHFDELLGLFGSK